MIKDLVRHVAQETGLTQKAARAALGTVLNAADRQGSPFTEALFKRLPGARTLAAKAGADAGAPTGAIAQLIEQTPGGQRHVAAGMLRALHAQGLGHREVGRLLPALGSYAETNYDIPAMASLGEVVTKDMVSGALSDVEASKAVQAA